MPQSPSHHFANFLKAVKGEEKARSNSAVAGPLCQARALGIIAQQLNTKLQFDAQAKRFTNSSAANELLAGPPTHHEWAQYDQM